MDAMTHMPVLLDEAIAGLAVREQGFYVDCTFGRGGHSRAILNQLGPDGRLLALDKDPQAIASIEAQRLADDPRFTLVQADFSELVEVVGHNCERDVVDGILMDLGVSSPQLDTPERGFAFLEDGPLDMRMNPDSGVSAAEWLQQVPEETLANVLYKYGEERFSRRIARAIVQRRIKQPLTRTRQLAELIEHTVPKRERHKHPATRSFQAIRIEINQELDRLVKSLEQSLELLGPGGRLAIITFHSLEDRIVKQFIRRESKATPLPKGLPVRERDTNLRLKALGKARPSRLEVMANPRARSAIIRVAERL